MNLIPTFNEFEISPALKEKIRTQFFKVARPLEKAQFKFLFEKGSPSAVIKELQAYQNFNGGFGHGIEPDFHLPSSTPMATSVALQILDILPESIEKEAMFRKAFTYFLSNYNYDRQGWFAVTEEVNKFPRAPWWEWDTKSKQTMIDNNWGNPSAEILGYFWQYQKFYPNWEINPIIDTAIRKFEKKEKYKSEHETYCYIRLFCHLNAEYQKKLGPLIQKAVSQLVVENPEKWGDYVPAPLNFLFHPKSLTWGISQTSIKSHIEFILHLLETDNVIIPVWEWGAYPNHWPLAKNDWTGVLTLRYLQILTRLNVKF